MKSKVAIVRCGSYNTEEVRKAVSRGLELMGGAESFVSQGEIEIMNYGVMSTPALVVDGIVKSSGKLLSIDEIIDLLKPSYKE